ncbi:preprotein translocase subunit YajC [Lactobacillus sp. ESL0684]|uniref:preprotein translocase subunit YajC n=1 Tax=Lactobacillus sp. ESL0684 TaxID=2983213 RepID=UPI0023F79D19|nr:preprotein translocase subunit YajC [Lactobacillus sp. ESL0684]WEV44176.1 preprotein translocase subunit YajC [Lactobacillus sp. ESL0684]
MNTLFLAKASGGMGSMWSIILLVVLFALMYFTMIKPQKKQQQKKAEMMNQLKKGDDVILIDGLHAKIDSVNTKDKTVVVDADGIYLTFSRMAVQQIVSSDTTDPAAIPANEAKQEEQAETAANESTEEQAQTPDKPADQAEQDKPSAE